MRKEEVMRRNLRSGPKPPETESPLFARPASPPSQPAALPRPKGGELPTPANSFAHHPAELGGSFRLHPTARTGLSTEFSRVLACCAANLRQTYQFARPACDLIQSQQQSLKASFAELPHREITDVQIIRDYRGSRGSGTRPPGENALIGQEINLWQNLSPVLAALPTVRHRLWE